MSDNYNFNDNNDSISARDNKNFYEENFENTEGEIETCM